MKHNRNPLATAIHYALGAGVVAGLAMTAAPVAAQDDDEEAADLDRVQVTGSRISRADIEGALPVTVIDRETIEFSGKTSVADLLRDTSFNSAGSFRPQSGSTGQSFAGLSLRALGEGRTVILIDGRRAPVAPNIGQAQDLNVVPLAAVERIEILADGASAVYGTDAIGGVVNIITRKDFTGAEITYGMGKPKREGGDTEEGSVLVGMTGDRGQVMVGASYNDREIIFARDREWSDTGASVFSNNFTDLTGAFLQNPQFGSVVPGDGCTADLFSVGGSGAGQRCFYNFAQISADEAAVRNESLFSRARYDINNNWSLLANASVSRVTSFGRYAPVPSSPWPGFGLPFVGAGDPNHPATPPDEGGNNPEWEAYQDVADQDLLFAHRFAANGPRDTQTDGNVYDLDVGLQGRIGQIDLDVGARRTESQYTEVGRNYIVAGLAQELIDNGQFNIYDPAGTDPDILQQFTATIGRDANFTQREYYASAATDLFDMAHGPLSVAFGAEYREEEYFDIFDSLSEAGQITGSAGNSAFGDRKIWAAFGEVLVPILDTLELSVAARYDDYNDFGDAFSPKVALRYQPMDQLTLRASWGEGFRAPPLDILAAEPSFSADNVVDAATCENLGLGPDCGEPGSAQVTAWVISNPDLMAEESEQWSAGFAFEPTDWLNGSVDYWNIKIDDRVASIGSQQIINCLLGTSQNCPPGLSELDPDVTPPDESQGLGVARFDNGAIDYVQRGFASLGTIETEGFDLNLRTNFNFGDMGRLRTDLQGTYVRRYITDGGANVAGDAGLPRMRATLSNQYSFGDFAFAWNINYIDDQNDSFASADQPLPSWTTHDVQANWYTPWNGQVTVGIDNLADKDPVLDAGTLRGFDFNLYDAYGRVPYIRYKQSF